MSNTINLSDFSINYVMHECGLSPDNTTAESAVRFMHSTVQKQWDLPKPTSLCRAKVVSDEVIKHVKPRVNLLQNHRDDFFGFDASINHDVLLIATICGPHIGYAHLPTEKGAASTDPEQFYKDGFNEDTSLGACVLYERAMEIESHGLSDKDDTYLKRESLFLAHINFLSDFDNIRGTLSKADIHQLREMLGTNIPAVQKFFDPLTQIGRETANCLDMLQDRIKERIADLAPAPTRGIASHLRLIPGFK